MKRANQSVSQSLMWIIRNFIPRSLARTLYVALIHPHFNYCNFILDGVNKSMKNKLQTHQNAALRAVLKVDLSYPTKQLLATTGFESVRTEMIKASCKMTFKGFYDLGPSALNDMFCLYVPERTLRSEDELRIVVPKCHTNFGQRNLAFCGCIHWNQLTVGIK